MSTTAVVLVVVAGVVSVVCATFCAYIGWRLESALADARLAFENARQQSEAAASAVTDTEEAARSARADREEARQRQQAAASAAEDAWEAAAAARADSEQARQEAQKAASAVEKAEEAALAARDAATEMADRIGVLEGELAGLRGEIRRQAGEPAVDSAVVPEADSGDPDQYGRSALPLSEAPVSMPALPRSLGYEWLDVSQEGPRRAGETVTVVEVVVRFPEATEADLGRRWTVAQRILTGPAPESCTDGKGAGPVWGTRLLAWSG